MELVSIVAAALATGAAAGLKPTAERAIKDAYAGLKTLLTSRYSRVNVQELEEAPDSLAERQTVEHGILSAGGGADRELLERALELLRLVERLSPGDARAVGVDLRSIRGASLTIDGVEATGTGVIVQDADIGGDIRVSGVRAGLPPTRQNP